MRRLAALALGTAVAAVAAPALACSCLPPPSAADQLARADVVFKGVAVGETVGRRGQATTQFRVQEMFKGRPADRIFVSHRLDSAACGVRFQPRASVVVIADRAENGTLRTSLCSAAAFPEAQYRRAAHGRPPVARCNAQAARFAVGQRYTPALGTRAQRAAGADQLRIREPGRAYTQDFRQGRLNLDLNRGGRVRDAACG